MTTLLEIGSGQRARRRKRVAVKKTNTIRKRAPKTKKNNLAPPISARYNELDRAIQEVIKMKKNNKNINLVGEFKKKIKKTKR